MAKKTKKKKPARKRARTKTTPPKTRNAKPTPAKRKAAKKPARASKPLAGAIKAGPIVPITAHKLKHLGRSSGTKYQPIIDTVSRFTKLGDSTPVSVPEGMAAGLFRRSLAVAFSRSKPVMPKGLTYAFRTTEDGKGIVVVAVKHRALGRPKNGERAAKAPRVHRKRVKKAAVKK